MNKEKDETIVIEPALALEMLRDGKKIPPNYLINGDLRINAPLNRISIHGNIDGSLIISKSINTLHISNYCRIYKSLIIQSGVALKYIEFNGTTNCAAHIHSNIEKYAYFAGQFHSDLVLRGSIKCDLQIESIITGNMDLSCRIYKDLLLNGEFSGKIKTNDRDIANIAALAKQGITIYLNDYRNENILEV